MINLLFKKFYLFHLNNFQVINQLKYIITLNNID